MCPNLGAKRMERVSVNLPDICPEALEPYRRAEQRKPTTLHAADFLGSPHVAEVARRSQMDAASTKGGVMN